MCVATIHPVVLHYFSGDRFWLQTDRRCVAVRFDPKQV
jgi:hypothetical protein